MLQYRKKKIAKLRGILLFLLQARIKSHKTEAWFFMNRLKLYLYCYFFNILLPFASINLVLPHFFPYKYLWSWTLKVWLGVFSYQFHLWLGITWIFCCQLKNILGVENDVWCNKNTVFIYLYIYVYIYIYVYSKLSPSLKSICSILYGTDCFGFILEFLVKL